MKSYLRQTVSNGSTGMVRLEMWGLLNIAAWSSELWATIIINRGV